MFNAIFMITCYPILFLMYFLLRNAKDRNNWCFGATLSKEQKKDPAIEEIDADYRKKFKNGMITMALVPFVTMFVPYESISFTIWMIWILLICFYPMVWYAQANEKVQKLKKERGWDTKSEVKYTDLKVITVPPRVKLVTFLPTLVLSVAAVVVTYVCFHESGYNAYRLCAITFGICTLLFYLSAIWTDRQKINVVSEDSDTNMNFARAKKKVWKDFWLISAWSNTVYTWSIVLAMYIRTAGMTIVLAGALVYSIVILGLAMNLVKKLLDINHKYQDKRTIEDAADDDRYWPYGLFYYNKNDKHFMVENRMGTGTALNMATGVGKSTYVVAVLCLLIIPISCIWMIMLDFTPIQTSVQNNTIVCEQLGIEYEIPLEEIEEYTILTELPEMTKLNGNGMDHVYSGTFEIYREGSVELFLNPQNDLYIKIITKDETYFISGATNQETQAIIDIIEKK